VVLAGLQISTSRPAEADSSNFDYYVLSLSWSPSFCETAAGRKTPSQCGPGRRYAFVVHGLWPQYHGGWPEYCRTGRHQTPSKKTIAKMRDIMPSTALIRHQWKKHGTCSGLSPKVYFSRTRDFWEDLTIPQPLRSADFYALLSPQELAELFLEANPELPRKALTLDCRNRRLREVRICFAKDGGFRECGANARRSCRSEKVYLPAAR
jgi:ribonuclease T2